MYNESTMEEVRHEKCPRCKCWRLPSDYLGTQGRRMKTCLTHCRKNKKRKLTLEECQRLAESRDGECLSTEYKNSSTKMRWRCDKRHEWNATFDNIKYGGTWCSKCSGCKKLTLEECQRLAESRDGECLSTKYKNNITKMKWRCSEGHEWSAIFGSIKNGQWCSDCSGNVKHTIEECQRLADSKDGECLSTEYINANTSMTWRCSEGHQWDATFSNIKNNGTWCGQCYGNVKLTLEECQQFAIKKGGECLSTEYKNKETNMKWRCDKGHEWDTTFGNIKNHGTWCSKCSGYRSEELCRDIFEKYLVEEFPTKRPEWLEGLELDGYNEEVNIAFEYNGRQHYEYNEHFHRGDYEIFEAQQARDLKKYRICRERNVDLIIIPYQYDYTNPTELEDFIFNELCKRC
jgi:hypothetical protein